jgi:para-aminobenzoate synthetase/4-amino-4-deoxychorismate lyase
MISIIKAKVNNPSISNILKNIFPCGSITGAPKLRTIEIIKEIEKEERGIYTGAIGFIAKNKYEFNVAIRTLVIDKENEIGLIGLGGGIVWDGIPQKEFEEVKLKAAFLTKQFVYFELFESFLVENKKVYLLNEHLKRLNKAADYFLFIQY